MLRLARHTTQALARSQGLLSNPIASARWMSSLPAHEVVPLPALSPTMTHGNLASWKLKEGDAISAGDIVCEIETDKAVVEYEAQDDAFLAKILLPEGTQDAAVGLPMMVTVEDEEDIAAFADFKAPEVDVAAPDLPEEAHLPTKEEVDVDSKTGQPVAPADFLVNSQTVVVPPAAPVIPASPEKAAAPAVPLSSTKVTIQEGPVAQSLFKQQNQYLELYGSTGTVPLPTK